MTIYKKSVELKEIVLTPPEVARALEDPLRVSLLDMLSQREMSIEEMVRELRRRRIRKAPTTVRHHLDLLKRAGLVELARLEDSRGGTLKYYASNTRVLAHSPPADFDERLGGAIEELSRGLLDPVGKVEKRHRQAIEEVASELRPCPHCDVRHFKEYLLLEMIRRAVVRASQTSEFGALLQR